MRRLVFPVACFWGLWSAASAQSVQLSSERGIASWYGTPYHGQPSASGEIYDQEKLTAAHRTLPFGTSVRVRRLDRDESIVVRINDRGPFVQSRIIDLSRAAAARLGMMAGGLAPVILEVVETPDSGVSKIAHAVVRTSIDETNRPLPCSARQRTRQRP